MKKIILASSSPRRKELLEKVGLKFEIEPSDLEEIVPTGVDPHELVLKMSLKKAETVAAKHRNAIIIAADTIGVIDGQIIGKPHTEYQARKMLQTISGKTHTVITGLTIIDTETNQRFSTTVDTNVHIKKLTPSEIRNYVETGEPLDKAGAYAIQGLGAVIVERIEGDYYNVVGLPLAVLVEALKEFGVSIL
jgi:septum formation protein